MNGLKEVAEWLENDSHHGGDRIIYDKMKQLFCYLPHDAFMALFKSALFTIRTLAETEEQFRSRDERTQNTTTADE